MTAVHVRLGPLSGVVRRRAGRRLSNWPVRARRKNRWMLVVEEVPIVVSCPACAASKTLESAWNLYCPTCGSPTPEILSGRELEVVALEIDP